jgi:hypothetical protein
MKALLTAVALSLVVGVTLVAPRDAAGALVVVGVLGLGAGYLVSRAGEDRRFLLHIFVGGLIVRVAIGTIIFALHLQAFFGGDAYTYDFLGALVLQSWRTGVPLVLAGRAQLDVGWGMAYFVAMIYYIAGQNMLAVQFANAVRASHLRQPACGACQCALRGFLSVARALVVTGAQGWPYGLHARAGGDGGPPAR